METPQGTAGIFVPPHTMLGGEALVALLYANILNDARQQTLDAAANARAWQNLSLRQAQNRESIDTRIHQNSATVDHLADTGALAATQTGQTENQTQVDPIRTGTGDDIADDKASTLAGVDVAKIAGAVAAAGQAVNADATNANNVTAQAAVLINAIAGMYGMKVAIIPPAPAA